ncbi:hypothetical protein RB653_004131 [Dictyostelium firmibasis]|uniref:Uncharacterized protein n=1 Tax=Dictyostelium firmibasis TaxID=79012 RepID=A0AAN7YXQ8_9MYCE
MSNNNNNNSIINEETDRNSNKSTKTKKTTLNVDYDKGILNLEISEGDILKCISGEIEGIRMIKLRMFHDLVIDRSLSELPFQKFYDCYSTLNNNNLNTKSFLSYLYTNVFQTLSERIKSDFQLICQERQISIRLSELERLLREQPTLANDKRAPPPSTINPDEQIMSQIIDLKMTERERLLTIYQNLLNENKKIKRQETDLEKQKTVLVDQINIKIENIKKLVDLSVSLDS